MSRLDLNDSLAFLDVVKAGGFSRAARALAIPKSTLSRKVAQLEERLGVKLIHRTTRTFLLTPAGETYYSKISGVMDEMGKIEEETRLDQGAAQGLVRFTAPVEMGESILAPILAKFRLSHPGVEVDLSLTDRVVNLVSEGFDLALRAGNLPDSTLRARKVGDNRFGLYGSKDLSRRLQGARTPYEVAEEPMVVFRPDQGSVPWLLTDGVSQVFLSPRSVVQVNSIRTAVALASLGTGLSLLPEFAIQKNSPSAPFRVLPGWSTKPNPLYIVYPETKFLPVRTRALIEILASELPSYF